MTTRIRSASLTNFAVVAAELGLDALSLVREARLPARCLDEPDLTVPAAAVGRLLELAAARGREPAFGLRMAESRRLSNLGPLGLLIRDEPTLHLALETLVRYIHIHNEALAVQVEQVGDSVVISTEMVTESGQPLRQGTELVIGVMFRTFGVFLGTRWKPRLVCFSHRAPADLGVHQRVFGKAIEFGHEFNGIVCDAADLDLPNPVADPAMMRYSQRLLEDDTTALVSMTGRVRQIVVLLLPHGYCQIERVAQHLGVDRRTLARRLSAEGTTFSCVVDHLRIELIERYTQGRSHPLAQIASLLGFSSASSFARWHRQQFGYPARERMKTPPSAGRTNHPAAVG